MGVERAPRGKMTLRMDSRLYAQMHSLRCIADTRDTPMPQGRFISLSRTCRASAAAQENATQRKRGKGQLSSETPGSSSKSPRSGVPPC